MIFLSTVADAKEILSIESVSVLGLLLLIIGCLLWYIKRMLNKADEREKEVAILVQDKDEKIMSFIEKYYIMSTKIYGILKRDQDV